jgi:hypothetical protein
MILAAVLAPMAVSAARRPGVEGDDQREREGSHFIQDHGSLSRPRAHRTSNGGTNAPCRLPNRAPATTFAVPEVVTQPVAVCRDW